MEKKLKQMEEEEMYAACYGGSPNGPGKVKSLFSYLPVGHLAFKGCPQIISPKKLRGQKQE